MEHNNTTLIPRFISYCNKKISGLNLIIHTQFPRMMVKVKEGFGEEDVLEAKQKQLLFVKVSLPDGSQDLLAISDLIDNLNLDQNAIYNKIYDTLKQMSLWYQEDKNTRQAYKST